MRTMRLGESAEKKAETNYLKISKDAMNTMLAANKAGKAGIGVRAFEHSLSARKSKPIVFDAAEKAEFDSWLMENYGDIPAIALDLGNLKRQFRRQKGVSPMAKIDVALDTKSPSFEAEAKAAQKKIGAALRKAENKVTAGKDVAHYSIRRGNQVTFLGYEAARNGQEAVAKWMGREDLLPKPEEFGTVKGYASYMRVMDLGGKHAKKTGQKSTHELVPQLVGLEGKRVEVVDAYGEKRRFYVGKSTGWVPVHLEIPLRNSTGGIQAMGAPFKSVKVIGER
jgi:hypothetical protein